MKRRLAPMILLLSALSLGGCQTTATGDAPGPEGWSGLINPNKARNLAAAAAAAVRKGGSIIAGNLTPARDTHEMAKTQSMEPDDPYITACTVDKGTTSFSSGWMDFQTAEFTIRKGEEKTVALSPKKPEAAQSFPHHRARGNSPRLHTAGLNAGFWVTREKDGQSLVFCAEDPAASASAGHSAAGATDNDCIKVIVLEDYLSHGITRTLDIPGAVRGGTIECGYDKPQFAEKTE